MEWERRQVWEALRRIPSGELIAILAKAADLYENGTLPMGDGQQSPDDFVHQQSASTGLPEHMCRANMSKNSFVLKNMEQILDCLTRGLDLEILTRGYGEEGRGVTVTYQAQSPALAAFDNEPDRWLDVRWDVDGSKQERFPARLALQSINEPGTLATIAQIIAAHSPEQWKRAFGVSPSAAQDPPDTNVAYEAYRSVRDDEPSQLIDIIFQQLLILALGVQMAGPELTPETFETGLFSYGPGTGTAGTWDFSPEHYTPITDARVLWWDPDVVSPFNGAPGTYVDNGERYSQDDMPEGQQEVFQ